MPAVLLGSERTGTPVVAFCRISDSEIRSREPVMHPDALIVQDATLLHQVQVFDALQRRRAGFADRGGESGDRCADQYLERPQRLHGAARLEVVAVLRPHQPGGRGPACAGVPHRRGAVGSGDGVHQPAAEHGLAGYNLHSPPSGPPSTSPGGRAPSTRSRPGSTNPPPCSRPGAACPAATASNATTVSASVRTTPSSNSAPATDTPSTTTSAKAAASAPPNAPAGPSVWNPRPSGARLASSNTQAARVRKVGIAAAALLRGPALSAHRLIRRRSGGAPRNVRPGASATLAIGSRSTQRALVCLGLVAKPVRVPAGSSRRHRTADGAAVRVPRVSDRR